MLFKKVFIESSQNVDDQRDAMLFSVNQLYLHKII